MLSPQRTSGALARAFTRLAALAAALGCAWVLAPAISAEPYHPVARDFGQALPALERATAVRQLRAGGHDHHADAGHDHAGEGPVSWVSPVIEAPARFDAAGLTKTKRPVELRGREEGGDWTKWVTAAGGDPVWFGGAEELQLRARGWRPDGRLHYVNVSGDATSSDGLLTKVRGAVNGAVVAATSLFAADRAVADVAKPKIVSRRAWGAEQRRGGCKPRRDPSYGRVRGAAVHHTVNANTYTRAEARDVVLAICRFHRNGNGWDDIGYQALVDRFGRIYEGRDGGLRRPVIGAHAQGVNALSTGVAVIGTHTKQRASRRAVRGVARWLAWKLERHGKPARGGTRMVSAGGATARYPKGTKFRVKRIFGHRDSNLSSCPGDGLYGQLRDIRRKASRIQERASGGSSDGGGTGGVGR